MGRILHVESAALTSNLAITTTQDTIILSTGEIAVPYEAASAVIIGWAQLTTGANTTGVSARIRRKPPATLPTVGENNTMTITAVAGSTEQMRVMAVDQLAGAASLRYSLSLIQAGATANGSVLQAGLLVLLLT